MKITELEFKLLYDENITKKRYEEIILKINNRFNYICSKFVIKTSRHQSWFDYGNTCQTHQDFETDGYFDPNDYLEWIEIGGKYIKPSPGYDLGVPTKWLWEDFEDELKQVMIKHRKEEQKVKRQQEKRRKERGKERITLEQSIRKKLTLEELKIIRFKK